MKKQPCPYRRIFRNVHIRRAFVIFAWLPIFVLIFLPLMAAKGIKDNMPDLLKEAINAFKDGNSYD